MTAVSIAIFFISAAVLGLELVLVRALSIGHWHHLSFLVISTALLGFGAGGTVVTVCSRRLCSEYLKWLWGLAVGFAIAAPIVFRISQKVPLDELQLIWDARQVVYLFTYYLLFFVPFFFAGTFVALAFTVSAEKASRLYFYNMAGSGLGAAAAVALMYGNSPERLLLVTSCVGFLSAVVVASRLSRRRVAGTLFCAAVCVVSFGGRGPFKLEIQISENKSLVYYSALPGAETIARSYSPLGRVDCVQAASIRYFPGLSIGYDGNLPEQKLIITDADGTSAVNNFSSFDELDCYRYATSALAYQLVNEPDVCVIGAGGGSDVGQGLLCGAKHVVAVEMNPQIIELVRENLGDFSGRLYDRRDVEVVVAEGRNFLQTTEQFFDIINISLLDSFSGSAAGVYALNESHLYTIEAIEQALHRLRAGGVLSITRLLKTPPRDSIKMFATVVEALRRTGVNNAAAHIIAIRSWATGTIVVSPRPFTKQQIENARRFTQKMRFDLAHLPGIKAKEINRFHQLEEPVYYESMQRILEDAEGFYRDYLYNVRPAADDKPYFFDFFKWRALPHMIRALGRRWLVFSEWGYLVLGATLFQAVCAGAFFVLLPLFIAKPLKTVRSRKPATLAYFLLLGLAYMFLEMGFIQKLTLLIGHPVFGVAVTLVGFLVFSGFGSLVSSRLAESPTRRIWAAVLAIVVIGIAEIIVLTMWFDWLVGFSMAGRIALGVAITAPLAFFMGMPFPTALAEINKAGRGLVPWAWGINGFASVTGVVLGTFLAISTGFTCLVFAALGCYLLAALVSRRLCT